MSKSSLDRAIKIREAFMDRPHREMRDMKWSWPTKMVEVGTCEAILYTSDKWQKDGKKIDYKHVAEGPQTLFLSPAIADGSNFKGPKAEVRDFPKFFAVLAESLGIQAHLYADNRGRSYSDYVEIKFPKGSTLAAGQLDDGSTFCFVYNSKGVLALVTGKKLDVLKDGIVG